MTNNQILKPEGTFVIRVYAIIINESNELLISDEFRLNMKMTKFPGGGMKFGEGTIDCLKREAIEEFGQQIEIIDHFYTTDYFQKAKFYENAQLISIYYRAFFPGPIRFKISDKAFDFAELKNGNMSFRWIQIARLKPDIFTFPVDRKVAGLISGTNYK